MASSQIEGDAAATLEQAARKTGGRFVVGGGEASGQNQSVRLRFGPDWTADLLAARRRLSAEVSVMLGLPPELEGEAGAGGAAREGWRRFIVGSAEPWARVVEEEVRRKLDDPGFRLSLDRLGGQDLRGRVLGYKALTEAGMSDEEARERVGW